MEAPKELTVSHTLTAADCNSLMELPPATLVRQIIDAATAHANALGAGYSRMFADGNAWVLSRLSTEMTRYPRVGETYTLTTWVESFNRHFSERVFEIADSRGEVIGAARSVWIGIDIASRRPADLSGLSLLAGSVSPRRCPMASRPRLRPESAYSASTPYSVETSDIDSNRHLTTARYVELAINRIPLPVFESVRIAELDIAFLHESLYGERLAIDNTLGDSSLAVAFTAPDGTVACLCKAALARRN